MVEPVSAVTVALAYVLGSIPTGYLMARARGVDIRAVGSGNIGATNVSRALGQRMGVLVLVLDALKGWAPVVTARALGATPIMVAAAGLAAIVGHMFTIFLRGRGGKGVATSLGVAIGFDPVAAGIGFAIFVGIFVATRLSSLAALIAIWAFPVASAVSHGLTADAGSGVAGLRADLAVAGLTAILVTWRLRDNIRRLVGGTELKA